MNKIKPYTDLLYNLQNQAIEFEESYRSKKKGEIYDHRLKYLSERIEHYTAAIRNIGIGSFKEYQITLATRRGSEVEINTIMIYYNSDIAEEDVKSLVLIKQMADYVMKLKVIKVYTTGIVYP